VESSEISAFGSNPALPGSGFTFSTVQHLPFLSVLFALWLPGDLQVWGNQGYADGNLACIAL
jgi:hypothetical protein